MPKITKRFVDKLAPDSTGKDVFIWDTGDGSLKGFGIRIKPSGVASYLVQYRNKEGRTRRLVLGKTNVLPADEAWDMASDKLKTASKGGDPSAERHAIRDSITVSELCDLYLKDAAMRIKPSTLATDRIRIESHVKPLLGRHSVKGLTSTDIERFQNDIAVGKTAKTRREKGRGGHAKGGRGTAARTLNMFTTILEFAKRRKIITENPAHGVKQFPSEKKKRFLSIEEITTLGDAMRDAEAKNKDNSTGFAAITALLLTGCRKTEILSLPWDWLDVKARCIRFGDTKTGAQIRPIGAAAVKHIENQPKCKTEDDKEVPWIFPADRGDGHFIGLRKVLRRLCTAAKIEGVSLHTFRHTFASVAAEMGFSELTIAGLLGHTVSGVTARYAHVPDSALLSAADRVSARIVAALDGQENNAQILPMERHVK